MDLHKYFSIRVWNVTCVYGTSANTLFCRYEPSLLATHHLKDAIWNKLQAFYPSLSKILEELKG